MKVYKHFYHVVDSACTLQSIIDAKSLLPPSKTKNSSFSYAIDKEDGKDNFTFLSYLSPTFSFVPARHIIICFRGQYLMNQHQSDPACIDAIKASNNFMQDDQRLDMGSTFTKKSTHDQLMARKSFYRNMKKDWLYYADILNERRYDFAAAAPKYSANDSSDSSYNPTWFEFIRSGFFRLPIQTIDNSAPYTSSDIRITAFEFWANSVEVNDQSVEKVFLLDPMENKEKAKCISILQKEGIDYSVIDSNNMEQENSLSLLVMQDFQ